MCQMKWPILFYILIGPNGKVTTSAFLHEGAETQAGILPEFAKHSREGRTAGTHIWTGVPTVKEVYCVISQQWLEKRLALPNGRVSLILDTDTYNEIDDQFALVYAATSGKARLDAVYAAPFHNSRSTGPEDGMLKSYEEIHKILRLLGLVAKTPVLKGSKRFMDASRSPIDSEACRHLVEHARQMPDGELLYVVAIGAITNVASALLIDPGIKDKIVVVWLGGHPVGWVDNLEFNLKQDPYAVQVVFDSGVPIIHVPCKNVAEHVRSTSPEIHALLHHRGEIGQYLTKIFDDYVRSAIAGSKEIWDLAAIACVLAPEAVKSVIAPTPILSLDSCLSWIVDKERHSYRVCIDIKRDIVFREFINALDNHLAK